MSAITALIIGRSRRAGESVPRKSRWTTSIGLGISIGFITLVLLSAAFPHALTGTDPLAVDPTVTLRPPSWQHIFGTDEDGRDLYTRVVYGASLSLRGSLIAVLIALVVGSLVGLVSGFIGGLVDTVIMRIVDVILAIPGLLLAMSIVTALGFGTMKVAISVGVASIAVFARLIRSEVYRVRGPDTSKLRASWAHRAPGFCSATSCPNTVGTVLTLAALEFRGASSRSAPLASSATEHNRPPRSGAPS